MIKSREGGCLRVQRENEEDATKRPYSKPRLTVYGRVSDLTTAKGGPDFDGSGGQSKL
jgi:hypothetical protein